MAGLYWPSGLLSPSLLRWVSSNGSCNGCACTDLYRLRCTGFLWGFCCCFSRRGSPDRVQRVQRLGSTFQRRNSEAPDFESERCIPHPTKLDSPIKLFLPGRLSGLG